MMRALVLLFLAPGCTLLLGAQQRPGCNDGIRDPGELCFQTQVLNVFLGAEYAITADIDGDGLDDVAVGDDAGLVEIFLSDEDGTLTANGTVNTAGEFINHIIAADFNGDGQTDLATANSTTFSVLLNNGGALTATNRPGCPNADNPDVSDCNSTNWIEAGDLDQNGTLDLLVVDEAADDPATGPDEGVAIWLNDGAANFTFLTNLDFGNNEQAAYVNDLDQDGQPEVIVALGDGHIGITENTASAGSPPIFAEPGTLLETFGDTETVAVGDFNGDGAKDLISAESGERLSLFFNPNAQSFDFPLASTFFLGGAPRTLVSLDLEGDGDIDLAVTNGVDDLGLTLLENDGAGVFRFARIFSEFDRVFGVVAGDINGDGLPDLLATANFLGDPDRPSLVVLLSAP